MGVGDRCSARTVRRVRGDRIRERVCARKARTGNAPAERAAGGGGGQDRPGESASVSGEDSSSVRTGSVVFDEEQRLIARGQFFDPA